MILKDLPDVLRRQIDYPTDPETVRSRIGGTEIEAPDHADSLTIGELLAHVEGDSYDSPEDLYSSIVASLPDAYIGRKYYDDRGANPLEFVAEEPEEPEDAADRSF